MKKLILPNLKNIWITLFWLKKFLERSVLYIRNTKCSADIIKE